MNWILGGKTNREYWAWLNLGVINHVAGTMWGHPSQSFLPQNWASTSHYFWSRGHFHPPSAKCPGTSPEVLSSTSHTHTLGHVSFLLWPRGPLGPISSAHPLAPALVKLSNFLAYIPTYYDFILACLPLVLLFSPYPDSFFSVFSISMCRFYFLNCLRYLRDHCILMQLPLTLCDLMETEPGSSALQADSLPSESPRTPHTLPAKASKLAQQAPDRDGGYWERARTPALCTSWVGARRSYSTYPRHTKAPKSLRKGQVPPKCLISRTNLCISHRACFPSI